MQTVPHAANRMLHRRKTNGVTSNKLDCEKSYNKQGKRKTNT